MPLEFCRSRSVGVSHNKHATAIAIAICATCATSLDSGDGGAPERGGGFAPLCIAAAAESIFLQPPASVALAAPASLIGGDPASLEVIVAASVRVGSGAACAAAEPAGGNWKPCATSAARICSCSACSRMRPAWACPTPTLMAFTSDASCVRTGLSMFARSWASACVATSCVLYDATSAFMPLVSDSVRDTNVPMFAWRPEGSRVLAASGSASGAAKLAIHR